MESRSLAVELIYHIIDHLWDDRDTLVACSLASRALLPATRYHLFHTVKLSRPSDSTRLRSVLDGSAVRGSDVAYYVRELRITPELTYYGSDKWEGCNLSEILQRVKGVECLRLGPLNWQSRFIEGAGQLLLSFTQLETLFLEDVYFDELDDMLHFLSVYPNLSTLHLLRCLCKQITYPSAFPASPQLEAGTNRLQELVFHGLPPCYSSRVVQWLDSSSRLRLRKLQWLCNKHGDEQAGLVALLRNQRVAAYLEHLYIEVIHFDGKPRITSDDDTLDLSSLTSVRDISLEIGPYSRDVLWLPQIGAIPSRMLRQIRFVVWGRDIRYCRSFYEGLTDWASLDAALAGAIGTRWPELTVVFEVRWYGAGEGITPKVVDLFGELLPNTHAKGARIEVLYSGPREQLVGYRA